MLHRARSAGAETPGLYCVDLACYTLVMEKVPGVRLKEVAQSLSPSRVRQLFFELGSVAGRLHVGGIMHGDLTTSNVMVDGDRLVLLDFGLASQTNRLEDRAVDLRLVKETLLGAHPGISTAALASLFEGYGQVVGQRVLSQTMGQLRSIERRGRYARPD